MASPMPESERAMVIATEKRLRRHGRRYAVEVPFLHRSIDMVWESPDKPERLVAVEFKLHDWKQALQQARDHLLGADEVYITLPRPRIHERLLVQARQTGIGVLAWNPRGELHKRQSFQPTDLLWEPTRQKLRESLEWRIRSMKERGEYPEVDAGPAEGAL